MVIDTQRELAPFRVAGTQRACGSEEKGAERDVAKRNIHRHTDTVWNGQ